MPHRKPDQKPNVIWIMADDLSWGDLGCYGQKIIKTPNIDRIAAEGIKFTQCYSGSTVCAPSRSSLMQGLHQGHATVRENFRCEYRHSLQPEDTTVAELFKKAGYVTGQFGKWGISLCDQPGIPTNKGFDSFFGYLNQRKAHSYYPEYLWQNTEKVMLPGNNGFDNRKVNEYDSDGNVIPNGVSDPKAVTYSADLIAEKAFDFVREHKDKPFFLYLPFTLPHGTLVAPSLDPYTNEDFPSLRHKEWAAMVTRLDGYVGRLMEMLAEFDIVENTLIFFCSDNGYSGGKKATGRSAPFRELTLDEFFHHSGPSQGTKGNLFESGVLVPMVARWPATVEPGTESNMVWAFWDFMATAADILSLPVPEKTDGVSILPTLLGDHDVQKQHEYLYWEYKDEQAVRLPDWYARRAHPEKPVELYAVEGVGAADEDSAAKNPEVVRLVERIFSEAHVQNPMQCAPGETDEQWLERMRENGIELPRNTDG
jgi:arylsulfatase A-like enzyme